jgi:phosphate transport system substrate-binding protein
MQKAESAPPRTPRKPWIPIFAGKKLAKFFLAFQRRIKPGIVVVFLWLLADCTGSRTLAPSTIRLKGSDTMIILTRLWAEEYMRQHPGISIYVEGGGTATGVEALIKGEADICAASRPLRSSEARRLLGKQGNLGVSHIVAKDALSVYLHPENPVRNLTLEQIQNIFTGKIKNWKEIGGGEEPVMLFNRSPNSGTYLYFQEHVLGGQPYADNVQTVTGTEAMVAAVANHRGAIGYGGIAYGSQLVHCSVDGVAPTAENVRNNSYAIARYLYFYTTRTPRGAVKTFIDWVLHRTGQRLIKQIGFIPIIEEPLK